MILKGHIFFIPDMGRHALSQLKIDQPRAPPDDAGGHGRDPVFRLFLSGGSSQPRGRAGPMSGQAAPVLFSVVTGQGVETMNRFGLADHPSCAASPSAAAPPTITRVSPQTTKTRSKLESTASSSVAPGSPASASGRAGSRWSTASFVAAPLKAATTPLRSGRNSF